MGNLITLTPHSVSLVRSDSSYPDAGIMQGSVLTIDRVLTPQHRYIIIVEGELVFRRLLIKPVPALQELKGDETITLLDEGQDFPSEAL